MGPYHDYHIAQRYVFTNFDSRPLASKSPNIRICAAGPRHRCVAKYATQHPNYTPYARTCSIVVARKGRQITQCVRRCLGSAWRLRLGTPLGKVYAYSFYTPIILACASFVHRMHFGLCVFFYTREFWSVRILSTSREFWSVRILYTPREFWSVRILLHPWILACAYSFYTPWILTYTEYTYTEYT